MLRLLVHNYTVFISLIKILHHFWNFVLDSSSVCYDIIMWMDHRAKEETETINKSRCSVLKYVGGKISLEMQPPKLKWLKNVNFSS